MTELESKLKQFINSRGLGDYVEELMSLKREAVNLVPNQINTTESTFGNSKLGGNPSVPKDFNWPVDDRGPLSFIAQIELGKLPKVSGFQSTKDTLLSFFYNNYSWGFNEEDSKTFRVFSFDKNQSLITANPPELPNKKSFFGFLQSEQKVRIYKECSLDTEKIFSFPLELDFPNFCDKSWDNYFELIEDLGGNHRMFGYPGQIQAEVNVECEFVARGYEGIKEVESSLYEEIEKAANRWQLLLQVDSDTDNSDMMWGDGGRLYFMIDKNDLEQENFENCWMISQCH